jgi:hypothetical protein
MMGPPMPETSKRINGEHMVLTTDYESDEEKQEKKSGMRHTSTNGVRKSVIFLVDGLHIQRQPSKQDVWQHGQLILEANGSATKILPILLFLS